MWFTSCEKRHRFQRRHRPALYFARERATNFCRAWCCHVLHKMGTFYAHTGGDKIHDNFEKHNMGTKHARAYNMTNFTRGATPGLTHFLMGGSLNSCPTRIKPRAEFVAGIPILNHKYIF